MRCRSPKWMDLRWRDTILEKIWGDASYSNSLALNVQVTYIRRLLVDPLLSIVSIKKKGYILVDGRQ